MALRCQDITAIYQIASVVGKEPPVVSLLIKLSAELYTVMAPWLNLSTSTGLLVTFDSSSISECWQWVIIIVGRARSFNSIPAPDPTVVAFYTPLGPTKDISIDFEIRSKFGVL